MFLVNPDARMPGSKAQFIVSVHITWVKRDSQAAERFSPVKRSQVTLGLYTHNRWFVLMGETAERR